jgi:serine/threonine-protein phosphatase Stp1
VSVDNALRAAVESWSSNETLDVRAAMTSAMHCANAAAWDPHWLKRPMTVGERLSHPTASITALAIREGRVVVGHVGLCRAYLVRSGVQRVLLAEHSVARTSAAHLDQAIRERFAHAPSRLIGFDNEVAVDIWDDEVGDGDMFVLCTDGVWGSMTEHRLLDLCTQGDAQDAADGLIREAISTSRVDAATAIVLRAYR